MGLGFKSKRETRYEHKDDCQIQLTYIKDSSWVKQEAAKMRDFCHSGDYRPVASIEATKAVASVKLFPCCEKLK